MNQFFLRIIHRSKFCKKILRVNLIYLVILNRDTLIILKTIIEKFCGISIRILRLPCSSRISHYDTHKFQIILLCKRYKSVLTFICISCLSPRTILVLQLWIICRTKHLVMIDEGISSFSLIGLRHPIYLRSRDSSECRILHSFSSNESHVICTCIVIFSPQTVGIGKVRISTSKTLRLSIHLLNKFVNISTYIMSNTITCLICRCQHNRIETFLHTYLLSGNNLYIRSTALPIGKCVLSIFDLLIKRAVFQCDQCSQNLSYTGRILLFLHILVIQNRTRINIHHTGGIGYQTWLCCRIGFHTSRKNSGNYN